MNNLTSLIKELRELDAAAMDGPWFMSSESFNSKHISSGKYDSINSYVGLTDGWGCDANAKLITRYRNVMSTLLDVIEEFMAMPKKECSCLADCAYGFRCTTCKGMLRVEQLAKEGRG